MLELLITAILSLVLDSTAFDVNKEVYEKCDSKDFNSVSFKSESGNDKDIEAKLFSSKDVVVTPDVDPL